MPSRTTRTPPSAGSFPKSAVLQRSRASRRSGLGGLRLPLAFAVTWTSAAARSLVDYRTASLARSITSSRILAELGPSVFVKMVNIRSLSG